MTEWYIDRAVDGLIWYREMQQALGEVSLEMEDGMGSVGQGRRCPWTKRPPGRILDGEGDGHRMLYPFRGQLKGHQG